jgi:hypothetical protein
MFRKISLPLACLALAGAHSAFAADYNEGQWVTSFMAGTELLGHATVFSGHTGTTADLGRVDSDLEGASGTTTLGHLSLNDAFRVGPSIGIETGYYATENIEPFVRMQYSQLYGRDRQIGELTSPALSTPQGVRANFADQDSFALDVGLRVFGDQIGVARPYLAGYVGADRTQAMKANIEVNNVGGLGQQELLPRKTRFDAGVEGGVDFQISPQSDFHLGVGAEYVNAHRESTDAFDALGIDSLQVSDRRWSFPIDVGVNYRF